MRSITFALLRLPLAILAWAAAVATAAAGSPARPVRAATREEIRQWVEALNSDRFVEREEATEKLMSAGPDAIAPLSEALQGNNLEVMTRGIFILQELAMSSEATTESAAWAALEKIAATRFTSAARRAADALNKLETLSQDRALAELKRLGATVGPETSEFVMPLNMVMPEGLTLVFGSNWRGTEKDLARLKRVHDLAELVFEGPLVTDEWLKYPGTVKGLSILTIKRAPITDAGVRQLRDAANIKTLRLLYSPIGDSSAESLQQLKGLELLKLYGTNVTRSAAEKLQTVLGDKLDFRCGGFMGIGCQDGQEGCIINLVRANSPAEKGDLRQNDAIYEYEGQPVTDFKSLTGLIGKNRAGDTVTVKLLRGETRLTKKVTLGEWE